MERSRDDRNTDAPGTVLAGPHPTLDVWAFVRYEDFDRTEQNVLNALLPLVPESDWQVTEYTRHVTVTISRGKADLLFFSIDSEPIACHAISFDEETIVNLSRSCGIPMLSLIRPYIEALKVAPGVIAIGAGFEISVPKSLRKEDIRKAKIALIAQPDGEGHWVEEELLGFVGHYL